MECLDEETILAFCRGGLAPDVREQAQEHLGTCDECRQLVSAVARSSFADSPPVPRPDIELPFAISGMRADTASDVRVMIGSHGAAAIDPEEREDRPRGALLRPRLDPAMAPTTPVGGAGFTGPSSSPVRPGQILGGKFEVERVLGQGGMGIVVAARHTQLDQRVALKFLLPVACEVPGAVARFLREGKAAARITSEHVARVMDTGVLENDETRGAPYLVMEYLEGSDLGVVVQQRGRIRPDEAMEYVLQACEAIVEAHDLGIVHRDLKPANLFLSRRADGSPLVKVLDFGISKVEGGGSRSQLTSASVLMGSPRYMSPEQMMSAKDVDARTDVWALGVILYELVTGKPVWHADTMQGLCALIATTPAPSLRDELPTAPLVLEEVIARCLVKSREGRMASVADLALALAPIAPSAARTSIERILRVGRRGRDGRGAPGAFAAEGAAPAAMPGANAVSAEIPGLLQAPLPPDATTNGNRKNKSPSVGLILGVAVAVLLLAGIAVNAALAQRAPTTLVGSEPTIGPAVGATVPAATPATSAPPGAPASASASAPPAPLPFAAAPLVEAAVPVPVPVATASASVSVARRMPRSPTPSTVTQLPPSTAAAAAAQPVAGPKPEAKPPAPSEPSRALTDRK